MRIAGASLDAAVAVVIVVAGIVVIVVQYPLKADSLSAGFLRPNVHCSSL